jgi:hypothetical protein
MILHVGRFDTAENQAALVPVAAKRWRAATTSSSCRGRRAVARRRSAAAGVLPMFRFLARAATCRVYWRRPTARPAVAGKVCRARPEALGAGVPVVASPIAPVRRSRAGRAG